MTVRAGYEKSIRIIYDGDPRFIPAGTKVKIRFTGEGFDLPDTMSVNEGIQPYAWESYNYLYFKPDGEDAIELYSWGFAYDVNEIDYVAQKPGEFYVIFSSGK